MFHSGMTAAFQNVDEAGHVRVNVAVRIDQGVPYTSLRSKVNDAREPLSFEERRYRLFVRQIHVDEPEGREMREGRETILFQLDAVIIVQIVQPDHRGTVIRQTVSYVVTYEPGCAGNQNLLCHAMVMRMRSDFGFGKP